MKQVSYISVVFFLIFSSGDLSADCGVAHYFRTLEQHIEDCAKAYPADALKSVRGMDNQIHSWRLVRRDKDVDYWQDQTPSVFDGRGKKLIWRSKRGQKLTHASAKKFCEDLNFDWSFLVREHEKYMATFTLPSEYALADAFRHGARDVFGWNPFSASWTEHSFDDGTACVLDFIQPLACQKIDQKMDLEFVCVGIPL